MSNTDLDLLERKMEADPDEMGRETFQRLEESLANPDPRIEAADREWLERTKRECGAEYDPDLVGRSPTRLGQLGTNPVQRESMDRWVKGAAREFMCGRGRKGCEEPIYAGGLCSKHYQRERRGTETDGKDQCKHQSCESDVHGRGLCMKHYQRARRAAKRSVDALQGLT